MILDHHGNPIDLRAIREPQSDSPALASIQSEFDAHPGAGLTPARLRAILRNAEQGDLIAQLELACDMEECDTQIYSELSKRAMALTTLEWDVEAPEDATPAEEKAAKQVRDWITSIPNFEESILLEMMGAVLKGFAPIEMWWELEERTLQPRFAPRPQRWMTVSENRQEIRLRDPQHTYGVPLRPANWILHRHKSVNGYDARSPLLRVLAWPYLYKAYALRDLAEFLEIYGLPLRLGKYPAGATDEEKRTLLRAVTAIGHNAAGIIPQSMLIEFENAAQGNDAPFRGSVELMDAAISKAILGQTLTSSEGQHGTQALGNVHNEIRLDILQSDARRVAGTLTQQLVAPMVLLNIPGIDPRRMPRFSIDVPEPEDLKLYADALPKLAAAGMRIGVQAMHRRLRIPEAEPGEDILQGPAAPAVPGEGGEDPPAAGDRARPGSPAPAKPPAAKAPAPAPGPSPAPARAALAAEPPPASAPRDALDDLVAEALADWRPLLQPLVGPLLDEMDRAVATGETLQSFAARLPDLIQRMDATAMGEQLARVGFSAQLAGAADLDL